MQAATTPTKATPLTTNDALEPMRFRARARTGWLRTSACRASNFRFPSSASGNVRVSIQPSIRRENKRWWVGHTLSAARGLF